MKKWSIQKKVIALILMLGIVLVGSLGVVSNVFFRRVVENQVLPISESAISTLSLNLRLQTYTYLSLLNTCTSDGEVEAMATDQYDSFVKKERAVADLNRLLSATNYWQRASWPFYMMMLCQDGTILTTQNYSYDGFMEDARESIMKDVYYDKMCNSSFKLTWMGVRDNPLLKKSGQQLYIAQNIVSERKTVGILICCIDISYFAAVMENGHISDQSDAYLVNKTGDLIACSKGDQQSFEKVQAALRNKNESGYVELEGKEHLYLQRKIDFQEFGSSWDLIMLHPVEDLMQELNSVRMTVFLIGLVLILVLLGVTVYINRAVLRPIVYYRRKINEIGTDNFDVEIRTVGQNEVLELGNGLKTMVNRIQKGMVKLRERENTLRMLEIQTLTAQINPHFIRNTLNSIRVMAEMSGTPVLAEAIRTFTKLIDYIFHGNRESTVEAELSYLQDYVGMQNLRWQHKFYFEVDVAEELMQERIPVLILQPIVENCITHGFWGRKGSGQIRLLGWKDGADMVFVVEDDGVGIEDPNILETKGKNPHGLSNIHSRLRLLYGEAYGLKISRGEVCGTVVEVRIPLGGDFNAEDYDRG